MKQVSKLIYREVINLIPDISKIPALTKTDLNSYGFQNIEITILTITEEEMQFVITNYVKHSAVLIPNPSVQISLHRNFKRAEVIGYKDPHFTFKVSPDVEHLDIYSSNHANRLVYEWLRELKLWKQNHENNLTGMLL